METPLLLLGLVLTVALVAPLSLRFGVSAPLALVLVGVAVSFVPTIPRVELEPELVLVGLLPPLLYAAAIRTSLVDFRANKRAIGLLSVGYVLFTAALVACVAWWLVPGLPFAAALALGAIVAPPDAVAATAIARRVGMPRRVVTILEGESLVNDATALVLLRTSVAAVGAGVSAVQVGLDFLLAAGGGLAVGMAAAWVVDRVRRRVIDPVVDTTLSFAAPFVAFIAAEEIHASGVLAVVVAGLLLGHKSLVSQSAASRVAERTNWATVQFLLENAVFLLIGLQLPAVVEAATDSDVGTGRLVGVCVGVMLVVLVGRPLWVFPATYLPRLIPAVGRADPPPPWTYPAVLSWAGMRGVVTLAAAASLPQDIPHRELLVLVAFVVVAGTLLLQGFTLPALVRRLRLPAPDPQEDALQEAAVLQEAAEAGLDRLEEVTGGDEPEDVMTRLRERALERAHGAWERVGAASRPGDTPSAAYRRLRLQMLGAERETVVRLRDEGNLADEVLRSVTARLDVEESLLDRLDDVSPSESTRVLHAPQPGGCEHLDDAPTVVHPTTDGCCEECLALGAEDWVHLRLCLTCGHVGCCDSSPLRHADSHYAEENHPVMRSLEPGEQWRWCYPDRLLG